MFTRCMPSCAFAKCRTRTARRATSPGSNPRTRSCAVAVPFFCEALPEHGLDDRDARRRGRLGARRAALRRRPRRQAAARSGCARSALAHLLPQHLQRLSHQPAGDAAGNAAALLAHLPESAEIPSCSATARDNSRSATARSDDASLRMAKRRATFTCRLASTPAGPAACRRCDLWRHATQAVSGEGPQQRRDHAGRRATRR